MTFTESVKVCFSKYAEFKGRASRSEFWWWFLFTTVAGIAAQVIGHVPAAVFAIGTLLPWIAVTARRLHDIDKSGWWQLIGIIPLIGWGLMIYWCVQDSGATNQYGDPPLRSGV